ncbi:hypothetical protein ACXN5S_17425 [Pseudoroseicyclus sp. H15]
MNTLFKAAPAAFAALFISGAANAQDMEMTGSLDSWDPGSQIIMLEGDATNYYFRLDDAFPEGLDIGDEVEFSYTMMDDRAYITEFYNVTDQEEAVLNPSGTSD